MNKSIFSKILVILLILSGIGTLLAAAGYPIYNPSLALNLRLIFFFLLFADAVCYFVAAWGANKNIKWLYPLTIALLVINALGLIFDDIGLVDISFSLFNILILIILIYNHRI